MSLIISFLKGLSLGTILFFAIPLVSKAVPWQYRKGIVESYQSMAFTVLGRALLIVREHGGFLLKGTVFDTRFGGERAKLGGETKHWRDPSNYMSRLRGKPFGLALEGYDVIIDARTAHIGRLTKQLHQTGRWEVDDLRCAYYTLPRARTILVNPVDAAPIIQGSASPGLADRLETYVEKGQSGFNTSQAVEFMQWLVGLGAGMGLMFMASKLAETTSGGSAVIPI